MALINTCLIVFGALALIVFATDQIVAFNNWQRRIHIGRQALAVLGGVDDDGVPGSHLVAQNDIGMEERRKKTM